MRRLFHKIISSLIRDEGRRVKYRLRHYFALHPEKRIAKEVEQVITTSRLHRETFGRFKNVNAGKDVVLVASGPTLRDYKPVPGAVHIGVNAAFKFDKVKMDYLFVQDVHGRRDLLEGINAYAPEGGCVKFYGIIDEWKMNTDYTVPESDALLAGALRYRNARMSPMGMQLDITVGALMDCGTVALPALQFALWTNPRRLYLVGCDCSTGYFNCEGAGDPRLAKRHDSMMMGYRIFRKFAAKWYPATEIISINPVGLKGMFKDEYI